MAKKLQRISAGVPWPRGIEIIAGKALVLARGCSRGAGGPHPFVFDQGGTIFSVDLNISEPVDKQKPASAKVRQNAKVFATTDPSVFRLWNKLKGHPHVNHPWEDIETDRPYATLKRDTKSRNLFICGFSGIDNAPNSGPFRKNATDCILRFDERDKKWREVERHDATQVPWSIRNSLDTRWIDNKYYTKKRQRPPYGLTNGPDGLLVRGDHLYAVAKDNDVLVQYDLNRIRAKPTARHPQSRVLFQLTKEDELLMTTNAGLVDIHGFSALATWEEFLYLGSRDKNLVVRFPQSESGEIDTARTELVADFGENTAAGKSPDLIDMAFNSRGELFVSTAGFGAVWKIARPSGASVYRPKNRRKYADLRKLSPNANAKCSNITFDSEDRLYICTNNDDVGGDLPHTAGTIYRVIEA